MSLESKIEQLIQDNNEQELLDLMETIKASHSVEDKLQVAAYLEIIGYFSLAKDLYLDLAPSYPDLYINLASIASEDGDMEQAFFYLEQIPKDSPDYLAALMGKAELYQLEGLPDVARDKINEALALSDDPLLVFAKAELDLEIGDDQAAIKSYASLNYDDIYQQTGISTYERIGQAYARLGKFQAAIEFLDKALELNYEDHILLELALLHMEEGNYQKANLYFKQLQTLSPDFEGYEYPYAQSLHEENQTQEALEVLKTGLAKNPFDGRLKLLAAQFSYELHDSKQAESYLLSALEDGEEEEEILLPLTNLYLEEERYQDILALDREDLTSVLTRWNMARAYEAEEELEGALEKYRELLPDLKNNPEFLESYIHLLRTMGYPEEAKEWAKSYMILVPDDLNMQDFLNQEDSF